MLWSIFGGKKFYYHLNYYNCPTKKPKKEKEKEKKDNEKKENEESKNNEKNEIMDIDNKNSLITKRNVYNIALIDKFIDILLRPMDWFDQKKMAEIQSQNC